MKASHKGLLKSLLLTSIAALGGTPNVNAAQAPIIGWSKEERNNDDSEIESIAGLLNTGVLTGSPSSNEIAGHTSHSSHSSHSSHFSHVSSSGGSYGGSSGGSKAGSAKGAAIAGGAILGGVILYYIIHKIVKSHKKHKTSRGSSSGGYGSSYAPITKNYASRELSKGKIGSDVDEMIDSLVANNALSRSEVKKAKNYYHYKYNSTVKKSVKKMQRRMGMEETGIGTVKFQSNLKVWKKKRHQFEQPILSDTINLENNTEALTAVAILLVEKGYLKSYKQDEINSPYERVIVFEAYHEFLKKQNLPISNDISFPILTQLYRLPTKQ